MAVEIATKENNAQTLPAGWKWVRLGDVVLAAKTGFACGERSETGVIQLRMNNVNTRGEFVWDTFIRVPCDGDKMRAYQLQNGDVLFNNTNSTELVGKSAFFCAHDEPIVFSNHFTRLQANATALEPTYLSYWLNSQWQQGVFAKMCNKWIGQSAVKSDKLLALTMPLPPLPEQKRIAAILNEQMAAVEKARIACEAQLEAAKTLHSAILRKAFRGEL